MTKQFTQERLAFGDNRLVPLLYGEHNTHLHKIEDAFNVEISNRGNEVMISGAAVNIDRARKILEGLWLEIQQGHDIDNHTVDAAIRFLEEHKKGGNHPARRRDDNSDAMNDDGETAIITKKKRIGPRNPMQAAYIEAMQTYNMVFGIGPAGTGKTYLAVAQAVAMMEAGKVERIILSRPALEAGERIGFLPGEMKEKMDPYMRPLYDALFDTMSGEKAQKRILSEEIEIAPLAFMRGRTLSNCFIILDEAQNTTTMQMLMALTRLGDNSHMIVTGDPSQTDLPNGTPSGLSEAMKILQGVDGISFVHFSDKDVVRHKLVAKIIQAYDKHKKKS